MVGGGRGWWKQDTSINIYIHIFVCINNNFLCLHLIERQRKVISS